MLAAIMLWAAALLAVSHSSIHAKTSHCLGQLHPEIRQRYGCGAGWHCDAVLVLKRHTLDQSVALGSVAGAGGSQEQDLSQLTWTGSQQCAAAPRVHAMVGACVHPWLCPTVHELSGAGPHLRSLCSCATCRFVRQTAEVENIMVSVERMLEYTSKKSHPLHAGAVAFSCVLFKRKKQHPISQHLTALAACCMCSQTSPQSRLW